MVVEADNISDEQKARICKKLGEADKVAVFQGFWIIEFEFDIILVYNELSIVIMLVAS